MIDFKKLRKKPKPKKKENIPFRDDGLSVMEKIETIVNKIESGMFLAESEKYYSFVDFQNHQPLSSYVLFRSDNLLLTLHLNVDFIRFEVKYNIDYKEIVPRMSYFCNYEASIPYRNLINKREEKKEICGFINSQIISKGLSKFELKNPYFIESVKLLLNNLNFHKTLSCFHIATFKDAIINMDNNPFYYLHWFIDGIKKYKYPPDEEKKKLLRVLDLAHVSKTNNVYFGATKIIYRQSMLKERDRIMLDPNSPGNLDIWYGGARIIKGYPSVEKDHPGLNLLAHSLSLFDGYDKFEVRIQQKVIENY